MPTRINFTRVPFNYRWPSGAVTCFRDLGEHLVKDEVAKAAISKGYAEAVTADRKAKTDGAKSAKKPRNVAAAKAAPNAGSSDRVDRGDLSAPDSADDLSSMAAAG